MHELITELIFLRNQQSIDIQWIPPIWQKLVRSEGRPSRSAVLQVLKKFSFTRETSFFRGFSLPIVQIPKFEGSDFQGNRPQYVVV